MWIAAVAGLSGSKLIVPPHFAKLPVIVSEPLATANPRVPPGWMVHAGAATDPDLSYADAY
jgi:hypothetical protein